MKILIDNGHGKDTPGKCSPDGRLREYKYCRRVALLLVRKLKTLGYDAVLLTPEDSDIPLRERCSRANAICRKTGKDNVVLISIHLNAAGNGSRWMNASGWEAWTSKGETKADRLADTLYRSARSVLPPHFPEEDPQKFIRTDYSDGDPDKESDFYILRHTLCPAVLTENLFQDNRRDADWLVSQTGLHTIVLLHLNAILEYCPAPPHLQK